MNARLRTTKFTKDCSVEKVKQKNLYQNIDADVKMIIIHCIQCLNKISSLSALSKILSSIF